LCIDLEKFYGRSPVAEELEIAITDRELYARLDKEFKSLSDPLAVKLSSNDYKEVTHYIEHGELEIAYEGFVLCLIASDITPPPTALVTVVAVLREMHRDVNLLTLDDWHEHDGYIAQSSKFSYRNIEAAIVSNDSLYASRPGDEHVFKGEFLLRFIVIDKDADEQYPGIWGRFDVSGSTPLMESISRRLTLFPDSVKKKLPAGHSAARTKWVVDSAATWFDKTWAG